MTAPPQTDAIQPTDPAPSKEHLEGADTTSPSLSPDIEGQPPSCPEKAPSEAKESAFKSLGLLDRFLAVWILLAMAIGILLGNFVPNTGPALQRGQFVGVSVPIGKERFRPKRIKRPLLMFSFHFLAIGLLVMMYPILCKVKYETLHLVFQKREVWVQIGFSIVANWIVAPLVMVRLSVNTPYLMLILLIWSSLVLRGRFFRINQICVRA